MNAAGIGFSTLFTLEGTGNVSVITAQLTGGIGSAMTQSGISMMNGTVTGIASYTQAGGAMGGKVTTPTYKLSGGTVSGEADFSSLFVLSGTGAVTATGKLIGSSGATMTQTGGSMSGTVLTTNYNISGGTVAGTVTVDGEVTISGTAKVDQGGWLLAADDLSVDADNNTIYPTITQNGDHSVFDGRVSSIDADGYLVQANAFTSYTLNAGLVDTHAYIVTATSSTRTAAP